MCKYKIEPPTFSLILEAGPLIGSKASIYNTFFNIQSQIYCPNSGHKKAI